MKAFCRRMARKFLPQSLKTSLARLACSRAVGKTIGKLYRDRIPSRGIVVSTGFSVVSERTKAEIYWGIYEGAEIRFVRDFLRSDLDVVELGSSLGVVSCHIRRKLDARARLLCVESNPSLVEIIDVNLRVNAAGREATILNRAIDYDPARTEAILLLRENTTASHVVHADRADGPSVRVPTARLRDLIHHHGIEHYALVADIEGAEAGIIIDDVEALNRCEQIIIELHDTVYAGRTYGYRDLAGILSERHGFRRKGEYGPVFAFLR